MAEPVEASSLYSGFGFGVQFNVGDFLRPVYAEDFPEMSPFQVLIVFSSSSNFGLNEPIV